MTKSIIIIRIGTMMRGKELIDVHRRNETEGKGLLHTATKNLLTEL